MISRAAENCFWLGRHLERIDNQIRFMSVNHAYILDVNPAREECWFPYVSVAGEEQRFLKLYGDESKCDEPVILDYLVYNDSNPVSVFNTINNARENARVIREIVSLELWESINEAWLWIQSNIAKRMYRQDKHAFYEKIKFYCQLFQGQFYTTMLQEEPFHFIQVGMMLERANQTARIIDVKSHRIHKQRESSETAEETIQWLTLLKLCSASESYMKRAYFALDGLQVADFLIYEENFPRSILFCLTTAAFSVQQLIPNTNSNIGSESLQLLSNLVEHLDNKQEITIKENDIHELLTHVVNMTAKICNGIHIEFFDPDILMRKRLKEIC